MVQSDVPSRWTMIFFPFFILSMIVCSVHPPMATGMTVTYVSEGRTMVMGKPSLSFIK
jgi:hypothetical protein